jgi:hypothetical protein
LAFGPRGVVLWNKDRFAEGEDRGDGLADLPAQRWTTQP